MMIQQTGLVLSYSPLKSCYDCASSAHSRAPHLPLSTSVRKSTLLIRISRFGPTYIETTPKLFVFVFFFFVAFTHKIPLLANRFRTVDPDVDSTNMRSAVVCNRFIYHGGQGKWGKGSSLVLFAGGRGGSIRWEEKPLLATDCGSRLDCQMSFVQVPARIRWKKYGMGQKKNGFREPWDLGEQDIPVAKSHSRLLPLPGHHGKLLYCFCVGDCHRSPLATYSNWMDDWVFIGEPSISMIRDDGELEPRNRPSFFSLFGNIRTKKSRPRVLVTK
ncbi:uncharacterized protein QC761_104647 [Podospora bellae-mahoneyi]|uniref:Uncharacterized protein n=1 Tax=Podospora bellae-mahoneyi TaxID=2093777 RepID=A0ABR0FV21_9PEZI|nr:hypothetical protein QC761_104647 [Podospora bellae-mahoneyi]